MRSRPCLLVQAGTPVKHPQWLEVWLKLGPRTKVPTEMPTSPVASPTEEAGVLELRADINVACFCMPLNVFLSVFLVCVF